MMNKSNINHSVKKGILITGVIGEDVHVTGIRILEHALRSAGFNVYSLGIHNSQEDFINAALEANADVIMISSLAGHAQLLVEGFRDKCIEAGLDDILLYIGGQLVIHAENWDKIEKIFKDMGFDRVYKPFTLPEPVIEDLEKDLEMRRRKNGCTQQEMAG
ncbi:MAG TPA: methylaspartate mutase subunit S [Candidatus Deferrimicrobium sp.]|nr:methylaspartate mutase subunit S [Candidatus Kapabacteria bacterium]HLP59846.1 methylaspartate mutase subunit S [Candidatus Deferrimicrobium sp.]